MSHVVRIDPKTGRRHVSVTLTVPVVIKIGQEAEELRERLIELDQLQSSQRSRAIAGGKRRSQKKFGAPRQAVIAAWFEWRSEPKTMSKQRFVWLQKQKHPHLADRTIPTWINQLDRVVTESFLRDDADDWLKTIFPHIVTRLLA